jgi:SOS-response transcriptional repressor LexA
MNKTNNKDVFERLEAVLKEKNIRPLDFQRTLEIKSQHWNNWRTRGVPAKYHPLIARILNLNLNWLITEEGSKYIDQISYESKVVDGPSIKGKVPLISWVQAGEFCEAIDNLQSGEAEEWLSCTSSCSKHTYALRVKGDSMTSPYPGKLSYLEGVIIYVDPERTITNGCRVVAKLPDSEEVTFKEYREDGGKRYLKPLNPQYSMIKITDETRLCGVVIGQYMPE